MNEAKEPTYHITKEIRKYIDFSNEKNVKKLSKTDDENQRKKLLEIQKQYLASYTAINKPAYMGNITKQLKTTLKDNYFAEKLDITTYKMAFKNGMMDLKTKEFRYGILSSDMITETILTDYKVGDENKIKYVRSELKKIMNNNEEHLEYLLSVFGFCFLGDPILEKSFWACIDGRTEADGSNGKTLCLNILLNIAPCYVYKSTCHMVENEYQKAHKQIVKTKGKKIVWIDEMDGKKHINSALIKDVTNGGKYSNEVLFGTTEEITIQFCLFLLSNYRIKIDDKEKALYNRYKEISYASHFEEIEHNDPDNLKFVKNSKLTDILISDYRDEIFGLIIDYAHKYFTEKLPKIPELFKEKADKTKEKNDAFLSWFNENCERGANFKTRENDILYKCPIQKSTDLREKLEQFGFIYDRKLSMGYINGKKIQGGYTGFRIIEDEEDIENVENDIFTEEL